MKAIKFVRPASIEDHLWVGWKPLYPLKEKWRQRPVWLIWEGDGTPRHPEAEKLVGGASGLLSKPMRHPSEPGVD